MKDKLLNLTGLNEVAKQIQDYIRLKLEFYATKQWVQKQIPKQIQPIEYTAGDNITINNNVISAQIPEGSHLENTVIQIDWYKLKDLRDNGILQAGQQYRITDYVATTVQEETTSANHPFDIIVTADDECTLNENARAILHDGDDYFANCDLAAWELKYCLDNDTERFAWADRNGKGVVYYMKDEWNNECPYDFKGIMFSRYAINNLWSNDYSKVSEDLVESLRNSFCYDRNYGLPMAYKGFSIPNVGVEFGDLYWCYTFHAKNYDDGVFYDASVICNKERIDDYTNVCEDNVIKPYHDEYADRPFLYRLNNIVFNNYFSVVDGYYLNCRSNTFGNSCGYITFGYNCSSNTFGYNCSSNTFGYNCCYNTFGYNCCYNTFVGNCYSNTFVGNCYSNTFVDSCNYNAFGDSCQSNTFGAYCFSNTFDNECCHNTFGNECYSNTFGIGCNSNIFSDECHSNTFGNYCESNKFSSQCHSNTFGNFCENNTFGAYCYSNTFGNSCYYNTFRSQCHSNNIGDVCQSNTFGDGCSHNTFSNNCYSNTFGNYCDNNTFGKTCCYIKFSDKSQNTTIENYAIQGSSSNKINISELFPQIVQTTTPYKAYHIGLNSNGELVCVNNYDAASVDTSEIENAISDIENNISESEEVIAAAFDKTRITIGADENIKVTFSGTNNLDGCESLLEAILLLDAKLKNE